MTEATTFSEEQLRILRHMLGIDDARKRIAPYRNYYCANPGDERLHELARLGAVEMYRRTTEAEGGDYEWFTTTDAGRAAAIASQKARYFHPKKSKRVYSAFLDVSDCLPDLTFKQFLTDPQFAETRRRA